MSDVGAPPPDPVNESESDSTRSREELVVRKLEPRSRGAGLHTAARRHV